MLSQSSAKSSAVGSSASKIKKPLLIGQGAKDPRVGQAESDQFVKSMQEKNIPVIYALLPDEGSGFKRPENNVGFSHSPTSSLADTWAA